MVPFNLMRKFVFLTCSNFGKTGRMAAQGPRARNEEKEDRRRQMLTPQPHAPIQWDAGCTGKIIVVNSWSDSIEGLSHGGGSFLLFSSVAAPLDIFSFRLASRSPPANFPSSLAFLSLLFRSHAEKPRRRGAKAIAK